MSKFKSFFNTIFGRILCLAAGLIICLGSMWLTCRYVVLGKQIPHFTQQWYFDADVLTFIATIIVGGVGVTVAQILGRVMHRVTGEGTWLSLYWLATTVSVLVTILTFYTNEQFGAVEAKYSTETYTTLQEQKARYQNRLRHLNADLQTFMETEYLDLRRRHYLTKAEQLLQDRKNVITEVSSKLDYVTNQILSYQGEGSKDEVTADSAKEGVARDVVTLLGINRNLIDYLVICIRSFILVAFAIIPDLIGPFLIAFAFTGAKRGRKEKGEAFSQKILREAWYRVTGQEIEPLDDPLKDIRKKAITLLEPHEVRKLLPECPLLTDEIKTLKTRIYLEAPTETGKTTMMMKLLADAMGRGELLPENAELHIFDPKPADENNWPKWAKRYGANWNFGEIKVGLTELHSLFFERGKLSKNQRGRQKPIFILIDELPQIVDGFKAKFKENFSDHYSWGLMGARTVGFYMIVATQIATADAEGTKGRAAMRDNYQYRIRLRYKDNMRWALLKVSDFPWKLYRVPNLKGDIVKKGTDFTLSGIANYAKGKAEQHARTLLNAKDVIYERVVRSDTDTGTESGTDTVPVNLEIQPSGTESGTEEIWNKNSNVVPLVKKSVPPPYHPFTDTVPPQRTGTAGSYQAERTTFNESVPPWVKTYYPQVTAEEEKLVTEMRNNGESDNNIIKAVWGVKPTPKYRNMIKAVFYMNGDEQERKVK